MLLKPEIWKLYFLCVDFTNVYAKIHGFPVVPKEYGIRVYRNIKTKRKNSDHYIPTGSIINVDRGVLREKFFSLINF
ncbi:hypothetical protein CEN39_00740 [Fischerella thermalis CCMEE 5201]|jgi:hypothetical protein|nr:hypothetical protein CEN39_00740 [Fischerella thermalis CCMEE 5201]